MRSVAALWGSNSEETKSIYERMNRFANLLDIAVHIAFPQADLRVVCGGE